MKKIYINENSVVLLAESEDKMTFFMFFTEVKKFIAGLLSDPVGTRPSKKLLLRGFTNEKLRKELRNANIIQMNEKIDEPHNEDGTIESRYYISYKVPKKDFKKKMRRLYQKIFEK